jgi:uncharacterized DUF497 family protein
LYLQIVFTIDNIFYILITGAMMFVWNNEKNDILKKNRNISFDEIAELLNDRRNIIDVIQNSKHEGEKIYIIKVPKRYNLYLVPFLILDNQDICLKTIYPSRKHTKEYVN